MMGSAILEKDTTTGLCAACGIPLDSQYFDDSSVKDAPRVGEEIILARFEVPNQYCGVLEYFCQYTDAFARDSSKIVTPGLEWRLLSNNHALFPYVSFQRIINPWGFGSFPINLRLVENSTIELVVRGVFDPEVTEADVAAQLVGGRIVGRFWYNSSYGEVR